MKCKRCKIDIDIYKPPFGGYFCKKNHVQCAVCELSSSICIRCGEETKYKSPHFLSEKEYSSMTLSELKVPIVRDIKPANEEEKEFQKLRLSFLSGEANETNYFTARNDLNSVRTISALITKDLYSAKTDKKQEAQDESDFRFKKIIRALRETDYPDDQQETGSDDDNINRNLQYKMDYENPSQLKILYPQQSQIRASSIKQASSIACLSKISIQSDAEPDDEPIKKNVGISENSSLNFADFKATSCSNLVDSPPTGFPLSIQATSLDRHPFNCPISNCVGKIFLSDFNQHIIHDHPMLPLSQIKFGQFRELLIDVKLCTWSPYTIACFLMRNVVKNFSTPPLKDMLPMLLMMGRYRFKKSNADSFTISKSTESNEESWTNSDSLVIWLAGIVPEQCEISVGISIFSRNDSVLSRWLIDHLNPIQNPVNFEYVFKKARRLILSFRELQMLTNEFEDTLRCQVGLINHSLKDDH